MIFVRLNGSQSYQSLNKKSHNYFKKVSPKIAKALSLE